MRFATLIFLSAVGALAWAAEPLAPQAAVEARHAGFKKMGAALRVITNTLKADTPEIAKLGVPAQAIMTTAMEIPRWFPAGSDAAAGFETDALPDIWKNRPKFDAAANQLGVESRKLVAAVGAADVAAIKAAAKSVGDGCGDCHRSFRAD